jgi:hypothetical protein
MNDRLEKLERYVDWLLIINANKGNQPLNEAEAAYVHEVKTRVGYSGYNLVNEVVTMSAIREKFESLSSELRELENDYPQLKETK